MGFLWCARGFPGDGEAEELHCPDGLVDYCAEPGGGGGGEVVH